jgi:hypothetical protein
MSRLRGKGLLALAMCVACGLFAAPAEASFHLMKIREISGSGLGATNDAYVVLQMTSPGQNLVGGHILTVYDEDATTGPSYTFTIPGNVQLADNQRTILIGDTNVAGRDFTWDQLSTAIGAGNFGGAGALCFPDASPPDCVSWGTAFTGAPFIPDHATSFQAALPVTSALRRSISPGCPTLLEATDDTNNSATDFAVVPREPRGNAAAPVEKECDNVAPQTKIKKRPKNRSDDNSPTFKFSSTELYSKFKCKLDKKPFRGCKSPRTYHGLHPGTHTFKVKAIDRDGNVDSTPAKDSFKVLAG